MYLDQVLVCTGSLVVVGSLDRLEVRLLSWRPSLLVGSCEFGLCGLDDVFGSLARLDVRLLSWRPSLLVGSVGFGLWGGLGSSANEHQPCEHPGHILYSLSG